MKKFKFIIIEPSDNCATAFEDIPNKSVVNVGENSFIINQDIPFGHKFALVDIKKGKDIIKYAEVIGFATENISKGDWIHIHNIASNILGVINNG